MRQVSEKRKGENTAYGRISKRHLQSFPRCQICIARKMDGKQRLVRNATHIHHTRGKVGRLLCDTRFFNSACNDCHPAWVHQTNVADARRLGVLASPGDWNTCPE